MRALVTPKRAAAFAGIVLVLGLFGAASFALDLPETFTTSRIVAWLHEAGPLAPLLLVLTMAAAVVVSPIPSLPLDLAAGATFGPLLGTTYAVIGAEIGAVASFLIARVLGRDLLARLLRRSVAWCERCSDRHLALLVLVSRLLPVFSFDIVSYGAGLTNMSLAAFALATLIGMIPPTFALTYFGSSLAMAQWPLILGGAAMVALFLLAPKLAARYPTAWWAHLLFVSSSPASTPGPPPDREPGAATPARCGGCGGPLSPP